MPVIISPLNLVNMLNIDPEKIINSDKLVLVELLAQINETISEWEANATMVRQELLDRLEKENKDAELVGEYSLTKSKRVTFKTTLEEAQVLGAVKPAVDTTTLRKLYNKGIKIPNVEVTTYLSVRRLSQNENTGD